MERFRKGTPTGMHDMFGDEICVGDVLKEVGTGIEREVGMYKELLDSQGLNVARKGLWDGRRYEVIRKAEMPVDAENVVKVIDAEPEKPAETPQIVVENKAEEVPQAVEADNAEEAGETPEELQEEKAPEAAEEDKAESFPFAVLTDEMLVHELRNRGFRGRVEKVVTISYEL